MNFLIKFVEPTQMSYGNDIQTNFVNLRMFIKFTSILFQNRYLAFGSLMVEAFNKGNRAFNSLNENEITIEIFATFLGDFDLFSEEI